MRRFHGAELSGDPGRWRGMTSRKVTRRQRGGQSLPNRVSDVPEWLHKIYGVPLFNGAPVAKGLDLADERVEMIRGGAARETAAYRARLLFENEESRGTLYKAEANKPGQLEPERARLLVLARDSREKAKTLRIQAAKAELAAAEGKPLPREKQLACARFMSLLHINSELPFEAIAALAWWRDLSPRPYTPSRQRALRRLMHRNF